MAALLRAADAARGIAGSYVRRLLAALRHDRRPGTPAEHGLIEPLSERELDVLRLLGTDLDGPDIARELVVSLNTVRTHTKNIYAKLGVNNRRAAVRRASELDLLSRSRAATSPPRPLRRRGAPPDSPPRSPHMVMPPHHIRSYLSPRPAEGAGTTRRPVRTATRPAVRDPPPGAPRPPVGRLVRRTEPHPRQRRHHPHPRPVADQAALHGLLQKVRDMRPAAGLGHPGRPRPALPPDTIPTPITHERRPT